MFQSPEEEEENDEVVQQECLEEFSSKDYIMEPGIFSMLKR